LRLNDNSILKSGIKIKNFLNDNFFLLEKIAIDNVEKISEKNFYCTDDRNTGCSSLLKPTENLGLDVEYVDIVETISIESILDYINFPDNQTIKFLKTDTQGKDFDVIKSAGKYLTKIIGIKAEYNVKDHYESNNSAEEFLQYMLENNFLLINNDGYDFYFLNKEHLEKSYVFDLPEGI
jgi:hypothetical protein